MAGAWYVAYQMSELVLSMLQSTMHRRSLMIALFFLPIFIVLSVSLTVVAADILTPKTDPSPLPRKREDVNPVHQRA
jgi:hypothetical protein